MIKEIKFSRLNIDEQTLIKQINKSFKIEYEELYVLVNSNDWILFYNKNTNEYVYNIKIIKFDYDKQLRYKNIIKKYWNLIDKKEVSIIKLNQTLNFNLTIMYNNYNIIWK